MGYKEDEDKLTYKFEAGVSKSSFALNAARKAGLPLKLLERAKSKAN